MLYCVFYLIIVKRLREEKRRKRNTFAKPPGVRTRTFVSMHLSTQLHIIFLTAVGNEILKVKDLKMLRLVKKQRMSWNKAL